MSTLSLRTSARLLAHLRRRLWMPEDSWFAELARLSSATTDAQYKATGAVKLSRKNAPEQEVHGFGQSTEVVEFANRHHLILDKKVHHWIMTQGNRQGHIHGLDNSVGIPQVTNGIDMWIERADGSVFKGHRDWWIWHRKPREQTSGTGTSSASVAASPVPKRYFELARTIIEKPDGVDIFAERFFALTGRRAELLLDTDEEAVQSVAKALQAYMETKLLAETGVPI